MVGSVKKPQKRFTIGGLTFFVIFIASCLLIIGLAYTSDYEGAATADQTRHVVLILLVINIMANMIQIWDAARRLLEELKATLGMRK